MAEGVRHPFQDLRDFQDEHAAWARRNFGEEPFWKPALGVSEEVGELHHSLLKMSQGIRGTREEHDAKARDAVGDIIVYLTHLCTTMDWDLADLLHETWDEVGQRDWQANNHDGSTDG